MFFFFAVDKFSRRLTRRQANVEETSAIKGPCAKSPEKIHISISFLHTLIAKCKLTHYGLLILPVQRVIGPRIHLCTHSYLHIYGTTIACIMSSTRAPGLCCTLSPTSCVLPHCAANSSNRQPPSAIARHCIIRTECTHSKY